MKIIERNMLRFRYNKNHIYSIGVEHKEGRLFPLTSYETPEELKTGYMALCFLLKQDMEAGSLLPVMQEGKLAIVLDEMRSCQFDVFPTV